MRDRTGGPARRGVVTGGVAVTAVAAAVAAVVLCLAAGNGTAWTLGVGAGVPMSLLGALVANRQPQNRIGSVLLVTGLLALTGDVATHYAEYALVTRPGLAGGRLAAWYGSWYWIPWFAGMLVFVPLLFPTGRPPAGRWRALTWTALAGVAALVFGAMFQAELDLAYHPSFSAPNPVGFLPFGDVEDSGLAILLLWIVVHGMLAIASLVLRFRRADGEERQQLRLVAFAGVLTLTLYVGSNLAIDLWGREPGFLAEAVLPALMPLAAGLAVLRYRLWDIDRLVSRSVSYVAVTALLLGIYLTSVVVLQTALRPLTSGSDLTVALSTLITAALFRPLVRRVRAVVDRRFDRRRYDAARTIAGFGSRLRDQVDLDRVAGELERTAGEALHPSTSSLWLRRAAAADDGAA